MSDPMAPAPVPGRLVVRDLLAQMRASSREAFVASHPNPFLLQLTQTVSDPRAWKTTAFQTLVPDAVLSEGQAGLFAYEIVKRPGANAFGLMITVGRAVNNDIIVAETSVSKFHASIMKDPSGGYSITDASSNGTWVDGQQIERAKPHPLPDGCSIHLSKSILMKLYSAEKLFDHLTQAGSRPGR